MRVHRGSIVASLLLLTAACADDAGSSLQNPFSTIPPATTTTVAAPSTTAAPATTVAAPSTSAAATSSTLPDETAAAFGWSELDAGIEEGHLAVPLDYGAPDGEQASLYVVRHKAANPARRIGALLVNPGGPGAGGSDLAVFADQIYDQDLLDRFDIIGWDPRGTGQSEPLIDCIDDLDPVFAVDTGPDDAAEEQIVEAAAATFAAGCADRSGDLLGHVGTVDAARDMDQIRQALGEDQLSYFGWSYGTALGATWATMFPDTVRAAVLDGAVDPTVGRVDGLVEQAAGFENTFGLFLDDCAADATCPINNNGDPRSAVASLLAAIEAAPVPTSEGRPPLSQGIVEIAIADALYLDSAWPSLADALAAGLAGDGAPLLALYDEYYIRLDDGSSDPGAEAYFVISCSDDPDTTGVAAAAAERARFSASSSLLSSTAAFEVMICASMPPIDTENVELTGAGAGPIVVVGNTGDPATPYEGSKRMAATMEEGVFVSVEANQHTAYGLNECINGVIDDYLVDLTVPAAGTSC